VTFFVSSVTDTSFPNRYKVNRGGFMATQRTSLEIIENFLAQKRIAMVGVSRNPKEFSCMLFGELCRRGYDMIPVNPAATEILGRRCFARVRDIQPPPDATILMTAPAVTEAVICDCAEAGIQHVWMYSAGGQGAVSESAVEFCRERGIHVVEGECPYMFLPHAGLHRIHGWVRRIAGSYPRHAHHRAA